MNQIVPAKRQGTDVAAPEMQDYVTMLIEGQMFGIPVLTVQDVLGPQKITRIPLAPPEVAGSHNIRATPCERRPAQSPHDDVCHEPSMATIAVSEWMNPNELMVKPDSELVRLEGLMLYPIARIA